MKIDTRYDSSATSAPASGTLISSPTSFRDLFELAKTSAGADPGASTSASSTGSSGKAESAYETAVRELHEYLQKTPEQRMREAILKEMGLTEEDIQKMPPDQQNAIEAAIKEKVKEKLLEQAQENVDAQQSARSGGSRPLPMI